jgi:hypothetical protein
LGALSTYGGIAMIIMAIFMHDPEHDGMLIAYLVLERHLCGSTCFQYTLYPSFTQVFPLFWQLLAASNSGSIPLVLALEFKQESVT